MLHNFRGIRTDDDSLEVMGLVENYYGRLDIEILDCLAVESGVEQVIVVENYQVTSFRLLFYL